MHIYTNIMHVSFFKHIVLISLLGLGLGSTIAKAEKADATKPLEVEANQASYNDIKQSYQLKGQVFLKKGSILIRTEDAQIQVTPEGYQTAKAVGGPKGLAFLKQKREGLNEFFEGYAQTIEYNSQNDLIVLTGQAKLQRLDDKQRVLDEITSHQMTYNGRDETYQAIGKNGQNSGRIKAIIMPKIKP